MFDENVYRGWLEAAPDGIVVVDSRGSIVLANSLGLTIEKLVPQRFQMAHKAHREKYLIAPGPRAMGTGPTTCGLRQQDHPPHRYKAHSRARHEEPNPG